MLTFCMCSARTAFLSWPPMIPLLPDDWDSSHILLAASRLWVVQLSCSPVLCLLRSVFLVNSCSLLSTQCDVSGTICVLLCPHINTARSLSDTQLALARRL